MTLFLSFKTEVRECMTYAEEDLTGVARPYLGVTVRPLVDGVELLETRFIFDIGSVIARGAEPSEFDPFTCSCGVAGCAGIHEEVELTASDSEVHWTFPESCFRAVLNPEVFASDEPLVAKFDKRQYLQALADVEAEIVQLEASRGLPVVLPLDSYPELSEPFAQQLNNMRAHTREWISSQNAHKELFGPLINEELVVEFANEDRYSLGLTSLVYDKVEQLREARDACADSNDELDEDEDPLAFERLVVPQFLADRDCAIAFARTLSWETLSVLAFRCAGPDLTPEEVAAYYEPASVASREALWKDARVFVRKYL